LKIRGKDSDRLCVRGRHARANRGMRPEIAAETHEFGAEWHHGQAHPQQRVRVVGAAVDDEDPLELRVALVEGGHLPEKIGEALLVAIDRHDHCTPHVIER